MTEREAVRFSGTGVVWKDGEVESPGAAGAEGGASHAASAVKRFMRRLELFAGMGEADLDRIYAMSRPRLLRAGETLLEEGDPGDSMFIVVEGELEIAQRIGGRNVVVASRGAGEVVGEMSLLLREPRSATARAKVDTKLIEVGRSAVESILSCNPSAPLAILGTVTGRLRSTEALLREQEKLASLGRLAAGLMHELNNPAAAIRRKPSELRGTIEQLEEALLRFAAADGTEVERLTAIVRQRAVGGGPVQVQDPLAQSDREHELEDWLEERAVEQAWEIAPDLVATGWDVDALASLEREAGSRLPAAVRWLAARARVTSLLDETRRSAEAITRIVDSVKSYSRVDQAPVQRVDIQRSLDDTIAVLDHRLRQGFVVSREYASDLPELEAYTGELNQLWTILIENALDAMGNEGTLVVRTRVNSDEVVVEIVDDGPGIPADVQSKVFDPFFTTKDVGAGAGLGLHIAYSIVVNRHRGQIGFESRPGFTCFRVGLPLRPPGRDEPASAEPGLGASARSAPESR